MILKALGVLLTFFLGRWSVTKLPIHSHLSHLCESLLKYLLHDVMPEFWSFNWLCDRGLSAEAFLIQTILFHVEWREIYAVCLFRSLICFPSHRYPYINKDKCTHLLTLRQERNTQTDTQRERERALVFDSRELVTPKHCQVLPSSSIITCGELPVRALSSQNTISKCYNHQH